MKHFILAALLLFSLTGLIPLPGSGTLTPPPSGCPTLPTDNGVQIVSGQPTCIIGPDRDANYWYWAIDPTFQVPCLYLNQTPTVDFHNLVACTNSSGIDTLAIDSCAGQCTSKSTFYHRAVGPYFVWTRRQDGSPQAITPSSLPIGAIFQNQTHVASYTSLRAMMAAAQMGDNLSIPLMPTGVPLYFDAGRIDADNVTVTCQPGAIIGGANIDQVAAIKINANGFTLRGCEIAYTPNGSRGVDVMPFKKNVTIDGNYIHDVSGNPGSGLESGGCNGLLTVTNNKFNYNGAGGGGNSHNVYTGACGYNPWGQGWGADKLVFTGNSSTNVGGGGHFLKNRMPNFVITGNRFGCDGSMPNVARCESSAVIDFPCGGIGTFSKNTVELPLVNDSTRYIVSWAVEWIGLGLPTSDNSAYYEACSNVRGTVTVASNMITGIGTPPFPVLQAGQLLDPASLGAVLGYSISAPGIPFGTTISAFSAPPCPCTVTMSAAAQAPLANGQTSQVLPIGILPQAPQLTMDGNLFIGDGTDGCKVGHSMDSEWPATTPSMPAPIYTNSTVINCPDPSDYFTAGTENTIFASRSAAGLQPYPFLPQAPL